MNQSYLVIWQLGDNEQSHTETPIDIDINRSDIAEDIYEKILKEVSTKENVEEDVIVILNLCKL